MNNTKGSAILTTVLLVLGIFVLGGAAYALVPRSVLKEYFQTGDKPTQQQFSNTIDSTIHMQEDREMTGLKEHDPSKDYVPGDTAVKSDAVYQAKIITQDQKEFKLDTVQPVTFQWSPVKKPQGSVTYRLKVWQLMQGQTGSQAMKSNMPIVTKDITDASELTVSGIYTGPCRPPYLCDFVWSIDVILSANTGADVGGAMAPAAKEETGATMTR